MTKLLKKLLIILILFISINLSASNYTYGMKIGGTYSSADVHRSNEGEPEKLIDEDYYWGTFLSFYGYRKFYKMIDLQFEANYNQRGVSYDNQNTTTTYITIPSLELASLLKLNINGFSLYAGVFTSLTALKKREKSSFNFFSPSSSGYFQGGGGIGLDYGYTLGFELKYRKYVVDFRFNQGFDDFIYYENNNLGYSYFDNSQQFVLSLGYEF